MHRFERVGRRTFLADLGRAGVAVVAIGLGACGNDDEAAPLDVPDPGDAAAAALGGWRLVALGSVSAYVLVRGGEAVVVDTGVAGSADAIGSALTGGGASWDAVGHVILTHEHPDHVGSLDDVLTRAPAARAYAGAADIPAITSPREVRAVDDGDDVFGLRVVSTPGHTPGHVSVLDERASVLVAGDALIGQGGGVAPPAARFTEDMDAAMASVRKLGALAFEIALFGHGDPVTAGAAAEVARLTG